MTPDTVDRKSRAAWYVLAGLVVVVAGGLLVAYLRRPPQMGPDEDVFRTVDALYTAVRNQDDVRLTECEHRLHGYREAGKLPPKASDSLDRIIATARAGRWEVAAERLYAFMMAQRREGAH